MKKKIFVILGNQLFNLSFFSQFKKDHTFFLAEDFGLCTYEKHHKQKILLFLSSMRSFRDELQENGFEVIYKTIEEDDFKISYTEKLKKIANEFNIDSISVYEIEDKPFEKTFLTELPKNVTSIDGTIMLIAQAISSFNIWTGQSIKFNEAYKEILERIDHEN